MQAEGVADLSFSGDETSRVGWFFIDDLPPLSTARVLPDQIGILHLHWEEPGPTYVDEGRRLGRTRSGVDGGQTEVYPNALWCGGSGPFGAPKRFKTGKQLPTHPVTQRAPPEVLR